MTTETGAGGPTLQDSLRAFEQAHTFRNANHLRSAFHDDALVESVSSNGVALGADETVEAIRVALADGAYDMGGWRYEYLSPSVALSISDVRHRVNASHVRHETVYRLISGKDGLIWRGKLFKSNTEAVHHFKTTGPDLGMTP